MIAGADRLREKAREYELNKLAAEERGERGDAWTLVAVVLHEVADALDPLDDDEEAV